MHTIQKITSAFLGVLFLFPMWGMAQQSIKGRVTEAATQQPLPFANVCLWQDTTLVKCVSSDENGQFKIDNVYPGIYKISVSFIGYQTHIEYGIQVNAGKDRILQFSLQPSAIALESVEVTAERGIQSNDPMAVVSARTFSVEESELYVGSRFDPARMVANYAGVQGADDSRNDIVVRGNSPLGVLWRVEGIPIPNPNHFAVSGSTGGPVTIINNKALANSDFYSGAFPAEFGNAIAAVFDLKLRNGNNEKHQFTSQFGFLGTELAAEGPIKKQKSSYLAAYRYSTLALFSGAGIDIGTNAVPRYQDLNFKLNFPLNDGKSISVFGLAGKSDIDIVISQQKDTSEIDLYGQNDRDQYFGTRMATIGAVYTHPVNEKWLFKNTLAIAHENQHAFHQYIARHVDNNGMFVIDSVYDYLYFHFTQNKIADHVYASYRPAARWWIKAGIVAEFYQLLFNDSQFYETPPHWEVRWNTNKNTYIVQPYIQALHSINEKQDITFGLHGLYFGYNSTYSFPEPRVGWQFKINSKHMLSAGMGLHSQIIPFYVYFYLQPDSSGRRRIINQHVGPMKSHHNVVGYTYQGKFRFRAEIYYQYLFDIPVEVKPSAFSLVNQGSSFSRFFPSELTNKGTGYNTGVEFTFEKFVYGKYFLMSSLTLYDSKYKASDGKWRNTDFNGRYIFNFLAGKTFKASKKSTINIGTKFTYAGSRRYGIIDTLRTFAEREIIFSDSLYNQFQFPPYLRLDFKINFLVNNPKASHEIGIDLINVTNRRNILNYTFAPVQGTDRPPIKLNYQLGFLPLFYYKINFQANVR